MASHHPKDSSSAKGKDIAQSSPPTILQDNSQNEHDFLLWMDTLPTISDHSSFHHTSQHNQNLFPDPSAEALVDEWLRASELDETDPDDQISLEFPAQVPLEPTGTEGVLASASQEWLNLEVISQYFHMPIAQASKELGISLTTLKLRCRDLNIQRWPYRKLKTIQTLIRNVQHLGQSSDGVVDPGLRETISFLESLQRKVKESPDLPLDPHLMKFRQSYYKAMHTRKRKWEEGTSSTPATQAEQKVSVPEVIIISDSDSDDDENEGSKKFKHISEFYP